MTRFLLLAICLLTAGVARAQEQESGMLERIESNYRRGLQAMNANGKSDPSLRSPLENKTYAASSFTTKTFGATEYGGVKSAEIKTFATHSFLGIKNPWFGRKVYETNAENLGKREAREARGKYQTAAYSTRDFDRADKPDLQDGRPALPTAVNPRPYLIPGKTPGGVDKFTQNLKKDLTIDDVRDLLNKGRGE